MPVWHVQEEFQYFLTLYVAFGISHIIILHVLDLVTGM